MARELYELVALAMRYVFLAIILFLLIRIVLRSSRQYQQVREDKKKLKSVSPGYLEALEPQNLSGNRYVLLRETTIGRAKRCNIVVDADSVAEVHAIIFEKMGELYVGDFGSAQGTLLNGKRIGKRETLLYAGDELQFGDLICVLHLTGEEEVDE